MLRVGHDLLGVDLKVGGRLIFEGRGNTPSSGESGAN
jgi:hypothetical protein